MQCHSEGEPGFEAAKLMKQDIDELSAHFNAAEALLDRAARAGKGLAASLIVILLAIASIYLKLRELER